jgi:hypothetical protein
VEEALVRTLRSRGVTARGPILEVEIMGVEHSANAAIPGQFEGAVGWASLVTIKVHVPARPGCEAVVRGDRVWAQDRADPLAGSATRSDALRGEVQQLADRAIDLLQGNPACR